VLSALEQPELADDVVWPGPADLDHAVAGHLTVGSACGADDVGAGLTCERVAIDLAAPAAARARTPCPA
jgi:hypothetical protein